MALTTEEWFQVLFLRAEYRDRMLTMLRNHLEARFGPLSAEAAERVRTVWYSDVDRFANAVFEAKLLAELGL